MTREPKSGWDVLREQSAAHEPKPMRVQIPAYTDRWMMGDRYGEVVKITRKRNKLTANEKARTSYRWELEQEIAHVKLDKSGKTLRFILHDCEVV